MMWDVCGGESVMTSVMCVMGSVSWRVCNGVCVMASV